jgi:hypothetical protein
MKHILRLKWNLFLHEIDPPSPPHKINPRDKRYNITFLTGTFVLSPQPLAVTLYGSESG